MRLLVLIISVLLALAFVVWAWPEEAEASAGARPNVVVIMTDDQRADELQYMPHTKALIKSRGTTFNDAYVTQSLCCPSRSTFLTGQYAHNHRVLDNTPGGVNGGYAAYKPIQDRGLQKWMDNAGYKTGMVGKYLNYYNETRVPEGWDFWYAWMNGSDWSRNGALTGVPDGGPIDGITNEAVDFISREGGREQPFFLFVSHIASKGAQNSPAYDDLYANLTVQRDLAFNEWDVSDKPTFIQNMDLLTEAEKNAADAKLRDRARKLAQVDDGVKEIVDELQKEDELDNTYIIFTSDHGYHNGEHRMQLGKTFAYEEDISVPLLVRGPGVPQDAQRGGFVLNNDLAPTIANWGGANIPYVPDGRSFQPLIDNPAADWRNSFLVSKRGGGDQWTFNGMRIRDELFVEWGASGDREYYDLSNDRQQLNNTYNSLGTVKKNSYSTQISNLRSCEGHSCRVRENP